MALKAAMIVECTAKMCIRGQYHPRVPSVGSYWMGGYCYDDGTSTSIERCQKMRICVDRLERASPWELCKDT